MIVHVQWWSPKQITDLNKIKGQCLRPRCGGWVMGRGGGGTLDTWSLTLCSFHNGHTVDTMRLMKLAGRWCINSPRNPLMSECWTQVRVAGGLGTQWPVTHTEEPVIQSTDSRPKDLGFIPQAGVRRSQRRHDVSEVNPPLWALQVGLLLYFNTQSWSHAHTGRWFDHQIKWPTNIRNYDQLVTRCHINAKLLQG